MQAVNTGAMYGSVSGGARRSSSDRSGKIPISILIEPTDGAQGERRNVPAASYRRTSSSEISSPGLYEQHRTSLPVSYLTNPISSETSLSPKSHDVEYFHRRGGEASRTMLERNDSAWTNSDLTRKPRPPRPSYSEEQKFFIMYARIMRDHSWPEIEDHFAEIFGQRSKGGLTSVYYRVRKDWGLMEVLKSGPGSFAADCREVERRALNFSTEFLTQIGYIER